MAAFLLRPPRQRLLRPPHRGGRAAPAATAEAPAPAPATPPSAPPASSWRRSQRPDVLGPTARWRGVRRSFQGPQETQDTRLSNAVNGPRGVYDVPFYNSTYYLYNGYRTPGFTVGLGFGFHVFSWQVDTPGATQTNPRKTADGHVFQFSPAIQVPYFKSADGETEAYWTAAFAFTWGPNISPAYDPVDVGMGVLIQPEIQATAIGLGGSLGFGGQHFFGRNFALGIESGVYYAHMTIDATVKLEGHEIPPPDNSGWFLGGYAALTATVVVGE